MTDKTKAAAAETPAETTERPHRPQMHYVQGLERGTWITLVEFDFALTDGTGNLVFPESAQEIVGKIKRCKDASLRTMTVYNTLITTELPAYRAAMAS